MRQNLPRHSARRDAHRGLPRAGAATAAVIANTVFLHIGEIGMARAELVFDLGIVFGFGILIADQQADRRAGRLPFEHAGGMRGGTPSTTQPIAGPWLSPHE